MASGNITPDNYILEKGSLKLTSHYLSGEEALLSESNLTQLGKEICNIEKFYGQPMDVEWSFADGELYILQARPITTL